MSRLKLFGVPYSVGCQEDTSQAIDQHNAPRVIRETLSNIYDGFNIPLEFEDVGDINCEAVIPAVLDSTAERINDIVSIGDIPFAVGGAHTLTLGSLRGLHQAKKDFSLIYFDAHPDMMPDQAIHYGSTLNHALREEVIDPERLALIGIRQIELEEADIIDGRDIYSVEPHEFERFTTAEIVAQIKKRVTPPYYLSIDLDCLDPTLAPGVTTPFSGGLTPRELSFVVRELCRDEILGVELVELSPVRDINNLTASIAARTIQVIATAIAAHQ